MNVNTILAALNFHRIQLLWALIVVCILSVFPSKFATAGTLAKYNVIGKSVSTEMGKKTANDIEENIFLILSDDKLYILSDASPIGIDNKSMNIWREKWIEISSPSSNVIDIRARDQRIKKMRQLMEQKQAQGDYSPVSLEDIGEEIPPNVKRKIKQFQPDSYEQFRANNDLSVMKLFSDTFYEKFFGIRDVNINLIFQNKTSDIRSFRCGLWNYEFGHKTNLTTVTGVGSRGKTWVTEDERLRPLAKAVSGIPKDIYNFITMASSEHNLLKIIRQTNGVPIRIEEKLKSVYGLGSKSHSIKIELVVFETDKTIAEMSSMLPEQHSKGLLKMMELKHEE